MSTKGNAMTSDEQARNDLREIDGLGPKSAKTLLVLGIASCADLAQYLAEHSAEELSDRLAERGVHVAAKKIENEDWLGQARRKAAQASTEPAALKKEPTDTEGEHEDPTHPTSGPSEVRFDVTFKRENRRWGVTTYDERDGGSIEKHGTDPAEWADWILRKMTQHTELGFAPTESGAAPAPELEIEILDVQGSEAVRFKKLAVEVSFEVSGSDVDTLAAARTPFWIHVHTVAMESGAMNLVASMQEELEPEAFTYKKRLEFPIPEVGRYQLNSLVLVLPPTARMAVHQGPTLKVTP